MKPSIQAALTLLTPCQVATPNQATASNPCYTTPKAHMHK